MTATIDMASIDTGNTDRDAHVLSPDLLDVADPAHDDVPLARASAARARSGRVDGELTIGDVTAAADASTSSSAAPSRFMRRRLHAGFEATRRDPPPRLRHRLRAAGRGARQRREDRARPRVPRAELSPAGPDHGSGPVATPLIRSPCARQPAEHRRLRRRALQPRHVRGGPAAARPGARASSPTRSSPITEEFFRLGEGRADRWSYAPGQLELLDGVKAKAKANGLWNFFLPDAETGQGLSATSTTPTSPPSSARTRSPPSASTARRPTPATWRCSSGSARPSRRSSGSSRCSTARSARPSRMTEPDLAIVRRPQHRHARAVLDGDEWVINGEKYYISGAGDPRCKIMICMVRTNPDAAAAPAAVADPRADGHARRRDPRADARVRPRRRARTATCTCASPTCGCRRRTSSSARAAGFEISPAPPRPGPHPPLHALHRRGRAGARADGRARPEPRGVRQADHRPRQEHRARRPGPASRSRRCG